MSTRRSGFTLIEVVIALAILALVAVLGYRALASLTDSEVRLTAEAKRWRDLDAFFARLEADMREALPREVRTGAVMEAAWIGDVDRTGNAELRLSRAGPEFAIEAGSAGQRIGYRMRDGAIEVMYWPRLDQPATLPARAFALAEGIGEFHMSFLDMHGGWRPRWPAQGEPAVPRAVKVVVTLSDRTSIERWLALR
jgi:general secretion pathway protein J